MTEIQKQFIKYDILDINKNDFIKYLKCIYLVKDFYRDENGYYILEYYFRSIIKENAKLHTTNLYKISGYLTEKIKKATSEETKFLISRIKMESPDFDLSFAKAETTESKQDLNIADCISNLKSKGYLIYKPI